MDSEFKEYGHVSWNRVLERLTLTRNLLNLIKKIPKYSSNYLITHAENSAPAEMIYSETQAETIKEIPNYPSLRNQKKRAMESLRSILLE